MKIQEHYIIECTPGLEARILVRGLDDDVTIKRTLRAYRKARPEGTYIAIWPQDFKNFAILHAKNNRYIRIT